MAVILPDSVKFVSGAMESAVASEQIAPGDIVAVYRGRACVSVQDSEGCWDPTPSGMALARAEKEQVVFYATPGSVVEYREKIDPY